MQKADELQLFPRIREAMALARARTPEERETVIEGCTYLTREQALAVIANPPAGDLLAVWGNLTDIATGRNSRNAGSKVKAIQLWLSYAVGLPVSRRETREESTVRVVLEYGKGEAIDVRPLAVQLAGSKP